MEKGKDNIEPDKLIGFSGGVPGRQSEEHGQGVAGVMAPGEQLAGLVPGFCRELPVGCGEADS